MEEKNQHGNCSHDDQVNSTTSVLSNGAPQNLMQRISQEHPKEVQFSKMAPPAEEPLDLNIGLSFDDLFEESKEGPNPNPFSSTATGATAVNNVNPPKNNNGIQPPPLQPQQQPLPPYHTTDNNSLDEISSYVEERKKKQFEAYRRFILRKRARERAEVKKKAVAAAASLPAPPLAAAAAMQLPQHPPLKSITLPRAAATASPSAPPSLLVAAAAQPPQGPLPKSLGLPRAVVAASPPAQFLAAAAQPPQSPLPKPTVLPGAAASDMENLMLRWAVEKMNALGESYGKKILKGASAHARGTGSSSSQQPWASPQPNSEAKACTAKVIYEKSAIVIKDTSHGKQIKRPRLLNAVQSNNAHQKNRKDNGVRGMKQLLTVTTTGDGPEGKKVDGFLYKDGKGGDILIVCLCHGVFLSPTDFVKHANHTDWTNPMKHIVFNSPPLPPL
ncbi:wiskott-Aldrich syndrome protein homolog 1-like [Eucalyptus grandis]|uniref:wiskott-Aldrich syndrome protein homolog 1-like n=1 Tax=Eucalyptus grandis TaxID=71139 RepID=UPI00192EDA64|nr:wiskott-Aldrich syndrome protein homolog 1-like [Eucalyptus grandis]